MINSLSNRWLIADSLAMGITGRILLGVGMILGSPFWGALSDRH
jgi:hypothetical protein